MAEKLTDENIRAERLRLNIREIQTPTAPDAGRRLQVLISTYGQEGLRRLAEHSQPRVDGVEYLVSLQWPGKGSQPVIPSSLAARDDFRIVMHHTSRVSVNRTVALNLATSELALTSDDDVDLSEQGLESVIECMRKHPDYDIFSFKYESSSHSKRYSDTAFDLRNRPRYFYCTAFEIALRPDRVAGRLSFNPFFGINGEFPSGEEDIFVFDALEAGLRWRFEPIVMARHENKTLGNREDPDYKLIRVKGAIFTRLAPRIWPLRMLGHTVRYAGRGKLYPSRLRYLHAWLAGVRDSRRLEVFAERPVYRALYREIFSAAEDKAPHTPQ